MIDARLQAPAAAARADLDEPARLDANRVEQREDDPVEDLLDHHRAQARKAARPVLLVQQLRGQKYWD